MDQRVIEKAREFVDLSNDELRNMRREYKQLEWKYSAS